MGLFRDRNPRCPGDENRRHDRDMPLRRNTVSDKIVPAGHALGLLLLFGRQVPNVAGAVAMPAAYQCAAVASKTDRV